MFSVICMPKSKRVTQFQFSVCIVRVHVAELTIKLTLTLTLDYLTCSITQMCCCSHEPDVDVSHKQGD